MALLGRFRSPDRLWAVEVWSVRREQWYRVLLDGALIADKVGIETVRRLLREQGGLDLADLVEE